MQQMLQKKRRQINIKNLHMISTSHQWPMKPLVLGGKSSIKFIQDVGSRIAERTGEKRSTSYLFQRLGINTQRGNAASVLVAKKLQTL